VKEASVALVSTMYVSDPVAFTIPSTVQIGVPAGHTVSPYGIALNLRFLFRSTLMVFPFLNASFAAVIIHTNTNDRHVALGFVFFLDTAFHAPTPRPRKFDCQR
jgi:hypothetical protein